MEKAIILNGIGGLYKVRLIANNITLQCTARGVFRHAKVTPLPGDEVILEKSDTNDGYVIASICDRKNSLIRPAIANLTHLFVVIPTKKPTADYYTVDKLISAAQDKDIEPVIIITKADLDREVADEISTIYRSSGYDVIITDKDGTGDYYIRNYLENVAEHESIIAAFSGVSGAGKSTLMTRLFPSLDLKTGEISKKISRGKNTTRHTELYPIFENKTLCLIADTPGFSMIDFTNFDFIKEENVIYSFRELKDLSGQCRYTDCTHTKEDGCAVLEALNSGKICESRYKSFIKMREDINKRK